MYNAIIFLAVTVSILNITRRRLMRKSKKLPEEPHSISIQDRRPHPVGHVTKNIRITSNKYNRAVHHLEIMCDQEYSSGDCAGILPASSEEDVLELLDKLGISPRQETEGITCYAYLLYHADLYGKVSKRFFQELSKHTTEEYWRKKYLHLGFDDNVSFKVCVSRGLTPYRCLTDGATHLKIAAENLRKMFSNVTYRYYSISSSPSECKGRISLLVLVETWKGSYGDEYLGTCSAYLARLKFGDKVRLKVRSYELHMPPDPKAPLVMIGLGTGVAPFRAFVKEGSVERMSLYYGARIRTEEFYYGDFFTQSQMSGLRLGLAFSRDTPGRKEYVQNRISENKERLLKDLLCKRGYLYLCGSKSSARDIEGLIGDIGISVQDLKDEGRYMREVY
jgi:sulfite reductase alpha subunit-like flavoprotein